MYSKVCDIRIAGVAASVSNRWDSLYDISEEDEKTINKFIKNIGVKGRWSASPKQTTSDFCFAAAEKLLDEKGIDRNDVGVLVLVTQTADYSIPATACLLQDRLELKKSCIAFDVNLGCSGFTYGLEIVSSLLSFAEANYGLLLVGDTSARELKASVKKKTSRSAALLFGDSGTATLIEKAKSDGLCFAAATDGGGYKAIIAPYGHWRNPEKPENLSGGSQMNDVDVFNFATSEVPTQINEYMQKMGKTPDDYDDLVLHQANLMIMKRIAKKTGFPVEKMPISMDRFGNTSSSSIPITLVDKYGEAEGDGVVHALCCGFGVGLSWATLELELNISDILPLVHTDEYFKDGYNLDDQENIVSDDKPAKKGQ